MTTEEALEKLIGATSSIIGRVSRLDTYMRSISADTASEVDAVAYLRSRLEPIAYIPPAGGWAAQYKTIAYVVAQVLEGRVKGELLELGGGVSTVWIGLALRRLGLGHLTSVEHDPEFLQKTHELVRRHGLGSFVDVVHAPLVDQQVEGVTTSWYDLGAVRDQLPPLGLLFVDGPPAASEPAARKPAFPLLRDLLTNSAIVILDDVDRPGEQDVLQSWLDTEALSMVDRVGRAAILRHLGAAAADLPATPLS